MGGGLGSVLDSHILTSSSFLFSPLGTISLLRTLVGKANTLVQLEIAAQDEGGLAAQPNAQINISIVAGTVSPPSFEHAQYYFTIPEDIRPGSSVGTICAHNPPGIVPRGSSEHWANVRPAVLPAMESVIRSFSVAFWHLLKINSKAQRGEFSPIYVVLIGYLYAKRTLRVKGSMLA